MLYPEGNHIQGINFSVDEMGERKYLMKRFHRIRILPNSSMSLLCQETLINIKNVMNSVGKFDQFGRKIPCCSGWWSDFSQIQKKLSWILFPCNPDGSCHGLIEKYFGNYSHMAEYTVTESGNRVKQSKHRILN